MSESYPFSESTTRLWFRYDGGLVAPRVGPQFWAPPEWTETAKKLLDDAECAAVGANNFAASMRVIIDRAKKLGVP